MTIVPYILLGLIVSFSFCTSILYWIERAALKRARLIDLLLSYFHSRDAGPKEEVDP